MEEQLFRAAHEGDFYEVRRLVDAGANPDGGDDRGWTPLHHASFEGHFLLAKYLVEEAQVNVEQEDGYGSTALHEACRGRRFLLVHYLVETGGADVKAKDMDGVTPLHYASLHGCTDIAQYLVERRQANVDVKCKFGCTPLDDAIRSRYDSNHDVARYLLPRVTFLSLDTLCRCWENDAFVDLRLMAVEKYAQGRLLAGAFRRNPIHTLLHAMAFQDSIRLFPASVLSSLDEHGRLSIHVALTPSQNAAEREARSLSPLVVALLFEREPRSALARDPTTGLYPHETAAGLPSNDDDDANDDRWLELSYKMLRSNPQHLLSPRLAK